MPARILLVEDEPQLLDLLQRYLKRLNFEVDAYAHPLEALTAFQAAVQRYDLVIADLSLPEMSGDTLLTRMLGLNPSLRMLICSGSPFTVSNLPEPVQSQVGFLQKPFTPKMLAAAVDRLLKRNPDS